MNYFILSSLLLLVALDRVHGKGQRDFSDFSDKDQGDPSWCMGYEKYCSYETIKTQCRKMCNMTGNVDPSWCAAYKTYCNNNPSVQAQCPRTCAIAVHGDWAEWSNWGACSASCGEGGQKRHRKCDHPAPKNGGKECKMGKSHGMMEEEMRKCSNDKCPINGGYGDWSAFSKCTKTCGGGLHYKHRCCINPYPKHGGDDCSELGAPVEADVCNTMPCPIDGAYGNWTEWGTCDKTCGGGLQHKTRSCDNPPPRFGGKNCSHHGADKMSQACNEQPCPIDGGYTDWTPYSACSVSCGSGLQYKSRCCMDPLPAFGGKPCILLGAPVEIKKCETQACPIDGNWGEWEAFGICSNTCGDDGIKLRKRACSNPPAMFGGKDCPGDAIESEPCSRTPCPVNGGLTEWTDWSSCSATCGSDSSKTRTRTCTIPAPAHGGDDCIGDLSETTSCGLPNCAEYKYETGTATWDDAETACVAWGGHLATIEDQGEMDKIVGGFTAAGVVITSDIFVWIGLNDKTNTGEYKWISGTATNSFLPWGNGEPSHVDHHCVSVNLMTKTYWDRNCPTLYHYACKK